MLPLCCIVLYDWAFSSSDCGFILFYGCRFFLDMLHNQKSTNQSTLIIALISVEIVIGIVSLAIDVVGKAPPV
jgi:hypothetical protein